jgi:ABC-type amino acid transport substrate-binding protein
MKFWNGNKSPARQRYELEVLQQVVQATRETHGEASIEEDRTNYPLAEDESNVFKTGVDLFVTVKGNAKFNDREKIIVDEPIARGLLGKRLMVVREDQLDEFASISEEDSLKAKTVGIPETWVDAELFRSNGYQVNEIGSFEDMFQRLANREFDYVSLGAMEIEDAFRKLAMPVGGLAIDYHLLISYPMPLVFYVHPDQPELAQRISEGIKTISQNGQLDALFNRHFGKMIEGLHLAPRRTFHLKNPALDQI